MSYGCGEPAESATSSQYSDDYWSNPPSDINSDEYRVWYERYCSYFYPQMATEADIAGSSEDAINTVEPDTLSVNVNNSIVNSTVATSATTDTKKSSDATNDAEAGSAGKKRKKKGKKDSVVNAKPAEPPGKLLILVSSSLSSCTVLNIIRHFHC